jgi:hypothetical protein
MKTETYYLHQTPNELAKRLIEYVPIDKEDILYEAFRGEGAFYNNFPANNKKIWSEIEEGIDYKTVKDEYDWVITNPPFSLENKDGKRENAVWYLLNYFSDTAKKGIAFLVNDVCLLTPKRYDILAKKGFSLVRIVVCNIKKWRGRYYFLIFKKNGTPIIDYLTNNFD